MWIGANVLEVNESTMIAAVQFWLTNKVLNKDEHSPTVTGVKGPLMSHGSCNLFRIELAEAKQ